VGNVVSSYEAQTSDEIDLLVGETVLVTEKDSRFEFLFKFQWLVEGNQQYNQRRRILPLHQYFCFG
jgi:hypothetical protein